MSCIDHKWNHPRPTVWFSLSSAHYFSAVFYWGYCWSTTMWTRWNNEIKWVSPRENLSSGFPTQWDSNQSAQLHRLARQLKFARSKSRYDTFQLANNKGADQTGWSAPVLFANPWRQVFSRRGPNAWFMGLEKKKEVIMIKKYHIHNLQAKPWHREEDVPHNNLQTN